jgi:lysine 2,3-aminomutase
VPLAASHIEGRDGESWRIRGLDGKVREYCEVTAETSI